jgi:cupin 2 domain-containing protein
VRDAGNVFEDIGARAGEEEFRTLLVRPGLKVERIVSTGQCSPPGFWYDQAWDEWVLVVSGGAAVEFEDEGAPRTLKTGDYLHIASGRRHRVVWTQPDPPTVWLAIHSGDLPD